jgi:hypothetical protein
VAEGFALKDSVDFSLHFAAIVTRCALPHFCM